MNFKELLKAQIPTMVLFVILFVSATSLLRAATCFEGGIVLGYPGPFFIQCSGASIPGGGQYVGSPTFNPGLLAADLIIWWLVSVLLVSLAFRVIARRDSHT